MRRPFLALLLSVVAFAACSAPALVYDRLDWFVWWKVSGFTKLEADQQIRFDAEFAELWRWHRTRELPRYVGDLRALAEAAQRPMKSSQVGDWSRVIDVHWNAVVTKLAPEACVQLADLSDAQVTSTLKRVDRNIDADTAEFVAPPEAEVRAERDARVRRGVERWIGDLDADQELRLARWSAERPLTFRTWLEQRRRWRARFSAALHARRTPDFCAQIRQLFSRQGTDAKGELGSRFDVDRARWLDFLAELSSTLSATQRTHLRDALLALGNDFEALSAENAR
jgi:hypothetical protein